VHLSTRLRGFDRRARFRQHPRRELASKLCVEFRVAPAGERGLPAPVESPVAMRRSRRRIGVEPGRTSRCPRHSERSVGVLMEETCVSSLTTGTVRTGLKVSIRRAPWIRSSVCVLLLDATIAWREQRWRGHDVRHRWLRDQSDRRSMPGYRRAVRCLGRQFLRGTRGSPRGCRHPPEDSVRRLR
jgi:hypothetical protein